MPPLTRDAIFASLRRHSANVLSSMLTKIRAALGEFWQCVRIAREIEQYSDMSDAQLHAMHLQRETIVKNTYDQRIVRQTMRQHQKERMMPDQTTSWDLTPLVLDFVEWVAREPRTYADVMDAWKTSCPRLTVWEDCIEQKLVERSFDKTMGMLIAPTEAGYTLLSKHGRPSFEHRAGYLQEAAE